MEETTTGEKRSSCHKQLWPEPHLEERGALCSLLIQVVMECQIQEHYCSISDTSVKLTTGKIGLPDGACVLVARG